MKEFPQNQEKKIYPKKVLCQIVIMIVWRQRTPCACVCPSQIQQSRYCSLTHFRHTSTINLISFLLRIFNNNNHCEFCSQFTEFQLYIHMCVCLSVLKRDISIYLHRMMFQTIQTIYFLKAYHLVMTLTETKTYKKTKTPRHRQKQIQSASKTQYMLYFS